MRTSLKESFGLDVDSKPLRMVLIDDDEVLCKIVHGLAVCEGAKLDCYTSLAEMGSIGRLAEYDVAIVDYDLGTMNGLEIAAYLTAMFGDMPMVLISGKDREQYTGVDWPDSVKCFVNKDAGPVAILKAAQAQAQISQTASVAAV